MMKKKVVIKQKKLGEETQKSLPVIENSLPIKKIVKPNLIKYIIYRFEPNDLTSPTYYIVGFKIVCDLNQRESYVETTVSIEECKNKSDNEICLIAYNKMKTRIEEVSIELSSKKFIIGSEFVPPVS